MVDIKNPNKIIFPNFYPLFLQLEIITNVYRFINLTILDIISFFTSSFYIQTIDLYLLVSYIVTKGSF